MGLLRGRVFGEDYMIDADHVVIWSGGCDSTLLLKEVASKYATTDKPVVALSIDHYLIDEDKRRIENEKRLAILEELKRRKVRIIHHTITVTGDANMYTHAPNPMQAYMWLSTIAPYIKEDANVYLGYIRTDDAAMSLSAIIKLKDAITEFTGRDFTLSTPYLYHKKEDIVRELMRIDMYDMTWYCEFPTKESEPCGYCAPCQTHQDAILKLALNGHERAITMLPKHVKIIKKHLPNNERKLTLNEN